jgi:Zn-finger nucleic acid-binding protein
VAWKGERIVKCPKCGTLLNEVTKAGVLIDVCDRCLGVWLERGELEKITARLRQLEHDIDDDVRRFPSREPAWREDDDDRRAPRRRRWSEMFDIFD